MGSHSRHLPTTSTAVIQTVFLLCLFGTCSGGKIYDKLEFPKEESQDVSKNEIEVDSLDVDTTSSIQDILDETEEIEAEYVKKLSKPELENEIEILEKEKEAIEKLGSLQSDPENPTKQVTASNKPSYKPEQSQAHVSVVKPVKAVLDLFGGLINAVTDTVGDILDETIDIANQVADSPEFNQQVNNVTRSVNTLVEESSGLFRKVMEIKYEAGDRIISRINHSITVRKDQKKKLDDEEEVNDDDEEIDVESEQIKLDELQRKLDEQRKLIEEQQEQLNKDQEQLDKQKRKLEDDYSVYQPRIGA